MTSEKGNRLQSNAPLRAYIDEFGYRPTNSNFMGDPIFLNPEGDRVTSGAIEATTRYTGFSESYLGLLARLADDPEYMEGYERAQKRKSARLLPGGV